MHHGAESCVLFTGSAELDDLAPLGDGVVAVRLFGRRLDGHGVLCAGAQEPVTSDRHGQRHCLGYQLGRNILEGETGGRREVKEDRTSVRKRYPSEALVM